MWWVLGGFADQDVVGRRSGVGADAEQGIEGGMPCPAPIEAEHELIEVVLKVSRSFPLSTPSSNWYRRLIRFYGIET
jgi:hypothetical protein